MTPIEAITWLNDEADGQLEYVTVCNRVLRLIPFDGMVSVGFEDHGILFTDAKIARLSMQVLGDGGRLTSHSAEGRLAAAAIISAAYHDDWTVPWREAGIAIERFLRGIDDHETLLELLYSDDWIPEGIRWFA